MAGVSASPEAAAEMAAVQRAGAIHSAALDAVQAAMAEAMNLEIVSRRVDKLGRPIEEELEERHRQRVLAGTAKSSVGYEPPEAKPAAAPSVLVTLRSELSNLCARLGELRANYAISERALLAQIEAKAAQVAVAEEMSK